MSAKAASPDLETAYRLFFESTSDAAFVVPMPEGRLPGPFVEVNKATCDLLGYSREELLKLAPQDLHHVPLPTDLWQSMHRDLEEHGVARFERVLRSYDGRQIPVEINCRLFWVEGERFGIAIARDLSERMISERILRDRQRELSALLNASEQMAALVTPDTRILQINRVGAERFGAASADELIGKRIIDLSPESIRDNRRDIARRVVENHESVVFEDFRSGMYLHHTVNPVLDDDSKVTRFAIYSEDITVGYIRRNVDAILNSVDRHILAGDSLHQLIADCCARLQTVFRCPLVWFAPSSSLMTSGTHYFVGPLRESLSTGHISAYDSSLNEIETLQIASRDDQRFKSLFESLGDSSLKLLCLIPLQTADSRPGVLVLASQHPELFHRQEILRILDQVHNRLSVALEMVSEQQQLMLLRKALEVARNAMFIADREGRVVWTNRALVDSSGYSESEWVGCRLPMLSQSGDGSSESDDRWRKLRSGRVWSGETVERRKDGSEYTVLQSITPVTDSNGHISHFVSIQEDISERKRTEERMRYFAEHDPLTGLRNRHFLMTELRRLMSSGGFSRSEDRLALLYLDIDFFKPINDQHGHEIGDELLKAFGARLRKSVREHDVVSRLGGDEFVILLRPVQSLDTAYEVAGKILRSVRRPIRAQEMSFHITSSIGIAFMPSSSEVDPQELLRLADQALYRAKALGRDRCVAAELDEVHDAVPVTE
ncbi:sensor domain-containing protein [Mangrovitalea sediminis]|uniref:sensor domain-containing protein n=1 Tax=Mangrovitalea sediminis TaxID=1982043 RepID=UPI00130402C7|nr:PAS domain S-box protein [Mangrovitalea sediminis]